MANKDHSLDSKITKAALEEFYQYGFEKASLHKIAAKAEVTTGALYTRYKNKNALFSSIINVVYEGFKPYMEEIVKEYMDAQKNRNVDSFIKAMNHECEIYFNVLYDNKKEAIILFCKSSGSEAEKQLKKMIAYKEKGTVQFFAEFAREKSKKENNSDILESFEIDKHAIAMLMNMQFSLFNEVLTLSLPKDKALKCMESMEHFLSLGWKNLFEKYL